MVLLRCVRRKEFLDSILRGCRRTNYRLISTSENKKENETCPSPESVYKKIPDFSKPLENKAWASFGFHDTDRHEDLYRLHVISFWFITVLINGGLLVYFYGPDYKRLNWCKREAFIRLQEREQLGLEPIDMNYVDPSEIELPPDEDLQDEDIII